MWPISGFAPKIDPVALSVTMTSPQLTHDVLRLIGSYWEGIGIGLTCHRFAELLDPDFHIVIHQRNEGVVSRLPNKWLHGMSCIDMYSGTMTARVECDRGALLSVVLTNPSGSKVRHGIYRGYGWTWSCRVVYLHRDALAQADCNSADELPSALETVTRTMPDGPTRTLNAHLWPGLIFCAAVGQKMALDDLT